MAYALIWHGLQHFFPKWLGLDFIYLFLLLGVLINLGLALFNLLPIYPLDGSYVLQNLLPRPQAFRFRLFSERYGAALLLGLFVIGYISDVSPLGLLIGVPRDWLAGILLRGL